MSDNDLDAIRKRRLYLHEHVGQFRVDGTVQVTTRIGRLIEEDVPALIAEVERLRAALVERDRVGTPEWQYEQEQCAAEMRAEDDGGAQ